MTPAEKALLDLAKFTLDGRATFDESEPRFQVRAKASTDPQRFHLEWQRAEALGDATMFPNWTKYSLDPLLNDGEAALVCSDVDGMEWVRLKEIEYHWGGPHSERTIQKADDLFALYRSKQRSLSKGPIVRANFAVKFSDAKTPRTVTVRRGNVASFTRDDDAPLIEAWLVERGFVPPASPTSPKTKVSHAQPARAVAHD